MSGCCGAGKKYRNPKKPKIGSQIKDLMFTAANAIAEAVKSGEIVAAKEIVQARLDRCKKCQYLDVSRCTACGCYVQAKAAIKVSKCPMGYW
jgi:predicted Zn-ribbon and HTH transcriptional regulator